MTRSFLFSPGDNWHKIEKGARSTAEAIIIDLEDAVAPSQRALARGTAHKALRSLYFGHRLRLLRINSAASGQMWDDLKEVIKDGVKLEGIVLPKAEYPDTIHTLAQWLIDNGHGTTIGIYALIESAMGVLQVGQIAGSSPLLRGLMLGGEDLVASLGAKATPGRQALQYARGALVTAAAAYGLSAIDVVYLNFSDTAGLRRECDTAAQLGFTGKMVIHPKQIQIVNEAFAPSDTEIAWATGLLAQYHEQLAQDNGVFTYNGEMIDEAIVKRARRIVHGALHEI